MIVATLFHDIHRFMSNEQNKFISGEESMPRVREILKQFDIEKEALDKILYLIQEHDNKLKKEEIPLELKILQDADTLDAVGKRGLKRSLKYCKNKNFPVYNKAFDLNCAEYIPDVNPISTTHYVYRTMIPKAENMKTTAGKKIAAKKIDVLRKFVENNLKKQLK